MSATPRSYRPNVCIVLTDESREQVLVFRRVDSTLGNFRWQFPQGGLLPREQPQEGMFRELAEEIGTAEVEVLAALNEPICYEYPPDVLAALADRDPEKAGFHGQSQHWFLARLLGGEKAIRFDHHPPEFDAWQWVSPARALELVAPFKKEAYRQALTGFGMI
ncbi:MAG: RNA pyrophosphohydrolase [Deltaproteobacteria bacterium]|nr:RNA pyrophosphohydrolase [Deltaproteobacteria bacterium]